MTHFEKFYRLIDSVPEHCFDVIFDVAFEQISNNHFIQLEAE